MKLKMAKIIPIKTDKADPATTNMGKPTTLVRKGTYKRLWGQIGIKEAIKHLLKGRKFEFDVERAIFLTVLHRLMTSGSDRHGNAAGHPRNLMADFCKVGMGVVPRTFFCFASACFY